MCDILQWENLCHSFAKTVNVNGIEHWCTKQNKCGCFFFFFFFFFCKFLFLKKLHTILKTNKHAKYGVRDPSSVDGWSDKSDLNLPRLLSTNVMWSSKMSRNSQILILRYRQTKRFSFFVSYCFCNPSTACIFRTNCPISMGFSSN